MQVPINNKFWGRFTKYNAGISVNKPDSSASIIFGDKGDMLKASFTHHLDKSKKTVVVGEITKRFSLNENTFTVGGSYAVDSLTLVKGKLNNHEKRGAVFRGGPTLSGSGSTDPNLF
ncbi:putative Porin domain superfamily, eukaryotic porin/Tom40 [Helianthus debilis subsp. tardiflorus]